MKDFVNLDLPRLEETATMSEHMQDAIASAAHALPILLILYLKAPLKFQDFSKKLVSQIIATFLQLAVKYY